MERNVGSDLLPIGSKLPIFSLKSTAGETVTNKYLLDGKVGLVVFACNHCPYVKGSEEMLIETVNQFAHDGLRTVVISSNDTIEYPEDSFEMMKEKATQMKLPYPYLFDESQDIAKRFDAACTPECYLFDSIGTLIYHGAINNTPRDPSAERTNHLALAISQALEGAKPNPSFVHPIGCSIKWKKQ